MSARWSACLLCLAFTACAPRVTSTDGGRADKAPTAAPPEASANAPASSPVASRAEPPALEVAAPTLAEQSRIATQALQGGIAGGVQGGIAGMMPPPAAFVIAPIDGGGFGARFNTESYAHKDENSFRRASSDPLSTFSIDVDTASYANVRRFLNNGTLPPPGAVRIEELINYFRFAYPQPDSGQPFSVTTELAACPWNPAHLVALIGLQGQTIADRDLPARNLVFLIDVSGSMASPDKLPLVRQAMHLLVESLTARDRIAIVVYAGSSGLALPSTPGDQRARIDQALTSLEAGGSTNGAAGIQLAYQVAREHFVRGGVNRVILATDGDFNVGVSSHSDLVKLVETERQSGVFLSVLGVGTGNLKDSTMELLADKGNGNYSYLDSLHEARKVLLDEAGATLVTIAKDVKIQVEFNPSAVAAYRLIGYENRLLAAQDFNDDKKDAGEIGAGHSVTALYEIVPAGVEVQTPPIDPLKYQEPGGKAPAALSDELLTVKLRYKAPDAEHSRMMVTAMRNRPQPLAGNVGFATAVAEVGLLLTGSALAPAATFENAIARARQFRQDDSHGYRAEFVALAERAARLQAQQHAAQR